MRAAVFAVLLLLPARSVPAQPAAPEPAFLDPDRTAPAGTQYRTFHSQTVQGEVSYLIYLPPDYQASGERRYPVIYWLHGKGGSERSGASFVAQLDAAIKAGVSPAAIAVLVNGLRDSRYYDSHDGRRPVETVFIRDLIPHIDATYRTLARRESRALEGFSMGGFGSAHLGFKYPDLFGVVSIMSGALLDDDSVTTIADLYQKNFGGNQAYFHAGSPWVLVRDNAARIRGRTAIRIGVGDQDPLLERDTKYHELLDSLNIRHEFFTVPGVAHEQGKFYALRGVPGFEFYRQAFR
jgi:endo-1,4-beta-xylanase